MRVTRDKARPSQELDGESVAAKSRRRPPRNLPVQACFVDIDATITDDGEVRQIGSEHPLGNALFGVLRDIMVRNGWHAERAVAALAEYANRIVFWDYGDFIDEFHLPTAEPWDAMIKWHEAHLIVYEDAVRMVKDLHARGMPLYIISNNPIQGCLLKLQRAGLGSREGTPWFVDILGANKLRGQKCSVEFWERALAHTGLSAGRIAVVGDNPHDDFQVPASVGISAFFLVNRAQVIPVERRDAAYLVNDLGRVRELLDESKLSLPGPATAAGPE